MAQKSFQKAPSQSPPAPMADDPDEVDISAHTYANTSASPYSGEADSRRLLLSRASGHDDSMLSAAGGFSVGQRGGQGDQNPMRMLQQYMEEGVQGPGGLPSGLPPGMAAMLSGEAPGTTGAGSVVQEQKQNNAYLWRIIHAMFALALGIYIISMTPFSGVKFSRIDPSADMEGVGVQFFWAFATAELVLQSSRFFLEQGQVSPTGWVGFLIGVLPQPWKGWLALGSRYSGIYTTVVQDAMVVVFVLGCVAWWKGAGSN